MLGQIRIEFIVGILIFIIIVVFIVNQVNVTFSSILADSRSDILKAKALNVITILTEDKGNPKNWHRDETTIDVMLIVDISGSMDGSDSSWGTNCRLPCDSFGSGFCNPSGCRFGESCPDCSDCDNDGYRADPEESPCSINDAKDAAKIFVNLLNSTIDRSGLVAFNGLAHIYNGLTYDPDEVKDSIDSLDAEGYTAMGDGIANSTYELLSNGRTDSNLIAVLLSDGVSNRGQDSLNASIEAAKNGIEIYTVGLGDPDYIDEDLLKEIASITNGNYYYAPNSTDLNEIYEEIAVTITKDRYRIGLVEEYPYDLFNKKIEKLNADCSLLDIFDLGSYRLRIYNSTDEILFCGYENLEPPAALEMKYVEMMGDYWLVTLELW